MDKRFHNEHVPGSDQTETTREVVTAFFRSFSDGDAETFGRVASPDLIMWSIGDFWWSGSHNLAEAQVIRDSWVGGLKDGGSDLSVEILSVLADGNRASVETRINATWADGQAYESFVNYAVDVADGKVVGSREYFDTAYEARFRQADPPA